MRNVTLLDLKLGHFKLTDEQQAELVRKAGPVFVEIGLRVLRERMEAGRNVGQGAVESPPNDDQVKPCRARGTITNHSGGEHDS